MRIIKGILALISIAIICINCSAQTTRNDIFSIRDGILGVVVDNKVKYYYAFDGDSYSNYEFALPNGYRNVFSIRDGILGVVVDNKVKYYYAFDGD